MNGVSPEPTSVSTLAWIVLGLITALNLALIIPDIALCWRRLHDGDLDGLWWLATFTAIGTPVLFIMYVRAPRPAGRRYDRV